MRKGRGQETLAEERGHRETDTQGRLDAIRGVGESSNDPCPVHQATVSLNGLEGEALLTGIYKHSKRESTGCVRFSKEGETV